MSMTRAATSSVVRRNVSKRGRDACVDARDSQTGARLGFAGKLRWHATYPPWLLIAVEKLVGDEGFSNRGQGEGGCDGQQELTIRKKG